MGMTFKCVCGEGLKNNAIPAEHIFHLFKEDFREELLLALDPGESEVGKIKEIRDTVSENLFKNIYQLWICESCSRIHLTKNCAKDPRFFNVFTYRPEPWDQGSPLDSD